MPQPPPIDSVFLNVPFDDAYKPLFEAMVFTIYACGFSPRCALEMADSGEIRLEKILKLIRECRLGIHDISRTELDKASGLPRFNMPFELGLFLGAKWFGISSQRKKNTLILDREPYRYQQFLSDVAGQDIKSHQGKPPVIIRQVRNWLGDTHPHIRLPSGGHIASRYWHFRAALPVWCRDQRLDSHDLLFNDFTYLIWRWLDSNE